MKQLNRRNLLASGMAAAAASAFTASRAQSSTQGVYAHGSSAFTVLTGQARPGKQWSIHGDKAFSTKVSGADVRKSFSMIEIHTPPSRGPELHIHPGQNEVFYILSGSIGLQCGTDRAVLKAGDTYFAPAGIPHAYVTLGAAPAHILNVFDPAGDIEGFFADYAPVVDAPNPPDPAELAAVYVKHGIKVVGPPLRSSSFA